MGKQIPDNLRKGSVGIEFHLQPHVPHFFNAVPQVFL